MRTKHIALYTGLALAASAAPAFAVGQGVTVDRADTAIRITGFVPVICHARLSNDVVAMSDGVQDLGQLREFCNSPRGYSVHADFSDSLGTARLLVDGKPVELGEDNSAVVATSDHAAITSRSIQLDLGEDAAPGSVSFRIQPL